jgi:hypothetical protein
MSMSTFEMAAIGNANYDTQWSQMPVCYFFGKYPDCANINPQYCGLCGKYLCSKEGYNPCRQDYDRRIRGMFTEIGAWFRDRF